jgi:hypothetical protein
MLKALMEKYFQDIIKENPEISKEIDTIFETSVSEKVDIAVAEKVSALESDAEVKLAEFKTSIVDKLDEYVNLSMDEFIVEKETDIRGGLKVDIAEKTIDAIKTIFTTSEINLPEADKTIVEDMTKKVDDISAKLNEKVNENIEMSKQIFEFEKAIKFEHSTKEMTLSDKEKLMSLVEHIDCDTIEDFENKIKILKENAFTETKKEDKETSEKDDNFDDDELDKYLP